MIGRGMADDNEFGGAKPLQDRPSLLKFFLECHAVMGKSILITGGARSGKSRFAECLTLELGQPAIYIATAQVLDDEMAERVARHKARRGPEWQTVSEPLELVRALEESDGTGPRLVDCLTLWLTNLLLGGHDIKAQSEALVDALARQISPVIFVTNEVGAGIVPENRLAREFRDAAGLLNQRFATACDELWLCVAGHPMRVKPQ